MRNFRIHELAKWIDWWPTLVVHEGPFWTGGHYVIEDKPGLGIEINPDVAKAHLAPGEVWWGCRYRKARSPSPCNMRDMKKPRV